MTTRAQFQVRGSQMLADAQTLLDAGRAANAYYLAGYAVEMALKAVIARRFTAEDLPDRRFVSEVHTHDVSILLKLAQMQNALNAGGLPLQRSWATVSGWSERSRYEFASQAEAVELLAAIADPVDGVFPWLTTFW